MSVYVPRPENTSRGQRLALFFRRLVPRGLSDGLREVTQPLRFPGGQGRLLPLVVWASDRRLVRPLRSLGCVVIVQNPPAAKNPASQTGEPSCEQPADVLCLHVENETLLREWPNWLSAWPAVYQVVLCSRRLPREKLTAALLFAGLADLRQTVAGRWVVTSGQVRR